VDKNCYKTELDMLADNVIAFTAHEPGQLCAFVGYVSFRIWFNGLHH
jgi:hypothetical protein